MSKTHGDALTRVFAEQATGIAESPHGLGALYTAPWNDHGTVRPGGEKIETKEAAYDLLRVWGRGIAVPNAGAGSYYQFFEELGFTGAESIETCSSAGDWTLAVKDGEEGDWYLAHQSNRYPHHGFIYSVDFEHGFPTVEALREHINMLDEALREHTNMLNDASDA